MVGACAVNEAGAPVFRPGLELAELFYWGAVRPILDRDFPGLPHAASLIGYGSDVLGYDTVRSTDHNWGPRLQLFLDDDAHDGLAGAIDRALRVGLPARVAGYSTHFSAPDMDDGGTQIMEEPAGREVNHLVQICKVSDYVAGALGVNAFAELSSIDWMLLPEQRLLELTAGRVYHDGLGTLTALRTRFAYYPDVVWRYRMASQWQRISQEEAFVGRTGEVGDELGSRLVAARLVRTLMQLAFQQERVYAPYSKWLGTAFSRLKAAAQLEPLLLATLSAADWQAREQPLSAAYRFLAEQHNRLGVTPEVDPAIRLYFGRPFQVIFADRFAEALVATVDDAALMGIGRLIGSADQFVDSTDFTTEPQIVARLRALYER